MADSAAHYRRAINGLPCKNPCPICVKMAADAKGHAPGTFAYPIDTYGDEPE